MTTAEDFTRYATRLLQAAGLAEDRARDVAEILVEGDLLGHSTHGLALLPTYLKELETGSMAARGEPKVLADRPAALVWDGQRLPGPWLVLEAMAQAGTRARELGTCSVAIRRCHHIACLAAYLERAALEGFAMTLLSSAPTNAAVAPYGGTTGALSPSPIAFGYPTSEAPVMIDVSTSTTSNGFVAKCKAEGVKLPHPWVMDENGAASDDPAVAMPPRKGTILPLGGLDAGHKGFGLSLMVEALTSGLGGHGRADPPEGFGASVFVQMIDPAAFAGLAEFKRQADTVAHACRSSKSRIPGESVRMPGERGLVKKRAQLRDGMTIAPGILEALSEPAKRYGIPLPPSAPNT